MYLLFQGTPGTYLTSHSQASYTQDTAKPSVGSISLGLPRQQESAKSGKTRKVTAFYIDYLMTHN